MKPTHREFTEAIETFRVVDTCLRCIYDGECHMYRPLSVQLRMMLCDSNRGKDTSLLNRVSENLRLSPLIAIRYQEQRTFSGKTAWANNVRARAGSEDIEPKIAAMPFEITRFANGIEVADLLIDNDGKAIPVSEWLDQEITLHPVRLTIRSLIRTVADRGGGAHVHDKADHMVDILSKYGPGKVGFGALFTVAVARVVQRIGWYIVQFYEKKGVHGDLREIAACFDEEHECVREAAKVPDELYEQESEKFSLLSVGNR